MWLGGLGTIPTCTADLSVVKILRRGKMSGGHFVRDSKGGAGPASADAGASRGRENSIAAAIELFVTESLLLRIF